MDINNIYKLMKKSISSSSTSSNINLKYYNYLDDDQYLDDSRDDTYGGYGYNYGNGNGNYNNNYYNYNYYNYNYDDYGYNYNYGSYKYINYMYSVQYSYSYSNYGSYSYMHETKQNIENIPHENPSIPSKLNIHHVHRPTFINSWCSKIFPCSLSNIKVILCLLFFIYCFTMIPAKYFNFWKKKSIRLSSKYNIILNSCYMVVLISTITLSYYTFVVSYDKCMSNAVERISRIIWISLVATNVVLSTTNMNIILFSFLILKVIMDMVSIIYKLQVDADIQNQQSNYYYHFSDDNYILVTEIIDFIAWTLILNIFYFSSNMYVSDDAIKALAEHLRPKKKTKNKIQYEQVGTVEDEDEDEEMKFTIEDNDDDNNIELKTIRIDEGIETSELDEIENFIGPASTTTSNQFKCDSYDEASMFSRLYFVHVYSLLVKGFKMGKLSIFDLGNLADIDTPKYNFLLLLDALQKRTKSEKKVSLMKLLFDLHCYDILACGVLVLFSILGALGSIFCLNMLLQELENRPYINWNTKYFYCFLLLLGKMVESAFEHLFWMSGLKVSGRMQNSLISMCAYKSLRLSGSSRLKFDSGKINNLMSVDAKKLTELFVVCLIHWGSWCALCTIIVVIFGITSVVGNSSFVALLIILISLPISFFISKCQKKYTLEVQSHRDTRSKIMGEVVKEIRYVKAFSCESFLNDLLSRYRKSELNAVWKFQASKMMYYIMSEITVAVSPVAVLATYALVQKGELSSSIVFTTLAWCSYITRSVKAVPNLVATLYETSACLSRIDELFNASERSNEKDWLPYLKSQKKLDENYECAKFGAGCVINNSEAAQVCLKNACFSWTLSDQHNDPVYNLKDINFNFTYGQLVFVIGSVGSGKTTLLLSILGETNSSSNTIVDVKGLTTYVSDRPWVSANKSIRDNILMGKVYNEGWYEKCLNACCLIQDLKEIPGGDSSIIGDRGINLSGGQKQRINLCRAIYSKPDVILLDDVFSALDNVTGQRIFDACFSKSGILSDSIKIIATHQYNFLYDNDLSYNLVLKDGCIVSRGSIDELLKSNDNYVTDLLKSKTDDNDHVPLNKANTSVADIQKLMNSGSANKINVEHQEIGAVKMKHIMNYLKGWGPVFVFLIIFAVVFEQVTNVSISFKYSYITEKCDSKQGCSMSYKKGATHTLFAMLGFLITLKITRVITFIYGNYQASKKFEKAMRDAIIASKVSWFDKELTGRIVNRAVNDVTAIDQRMPDIIINVLQYLLSFITVILLVIVELPLALISFIVAPIYYRIYQVYRFPARDLKRLNSISTSPVISQINECIGGITTIRAFGLQLQMLREHLKFLEDSAKCYMFQWFANQWVTVVIELLGCILSSAITFSAVFYTINKKINPSTASMMISYANAIPMTLGELLKSFCSAEIESIAVERVSEYIELPPEEKGTFKKVSDYSPRYSNNYGKGEIKFINFTLKYDISNSDDKSDTENPLNESKEHAVLKNINLNIRPGSKICVCGRTGAGKSSLFNALYRFYEYDGIIKIDDFELKNLSLTEVRSLFGLIPQDAMLLGSTLREALTCGIHIPDEEIWTVLETLQIKEKIEMRGGLDMELNLGAVQFSAGEKQLLCTCRALLRKAAILLVDEVASTLDQNADEIINNIILSDKNVTVLSIMHRLQNCSRYDRIIVLNHGEVAEDGTYDELILRRGIFYDMINVQK